MSSSSALQPASVNKVVLASFVGTTIEWYDFFLYGTAAALVFNKLFFPTIDPAAGTMAAFATYAVGFFARPFGGVIFGHFGDKIGRKSMLVTTLMMMGVATFLIGVLPTYQQAGLLAPTLLVLLRFVQGLGVGGEWGGAVLMAVEHGAGAAAASGAAWFRRACPWDCCSRRRCLEFLHRCRRTSSSRGAGGCRFSWASCSRAWVCSSVCM